MVMICMCYAGVEHIYENMKHPDRNGEPMVIEAGSTVRKCENWIMGRWQAGVC